MKQHKEIRPRYAAREAWPAVPPRPATEDHDAYAGHEAKWAIYETHFGVRMAYAANKESAKIAAKRWNNGNIPEDLRMKAESAIYLRRLLKPGSTVATIIRSVSSSGMSRRISLIYNMQDITWHAARVMDEPVKQRGHYVQDRGLSIGGCGMDMGFAMVYNLSSALYPHGFTCTGSKCPSNDHSNGDRNREKHHHDSGGYAISQRWM
jgi:hypothetical protein